MSNNKRKISESSEAKPKSKPAKLKRAGTMETTAIEGNEFLEQEGAENLAKTPGGREGVETRGKQQARTTVNSLLSTSKNVTELAEADKKKEENKLKMVFRLFDKDKDGLLNADELTDALRSCGKKPTKAKVTALLDSVSGSKKKKNNNAITSDEFVAYMMAKMFKVKKAEKEKEQEKKAEKKTTSSPKTEKKTPAKKGEKEQEKEKEKEKEKKDDGKKKKNTPKKEVPEKKKDAEKEKEPETIKPMERARSITEFYTEHAGMNTEIVAEKLDKFSNPAGVEYDLGHEGAFNGFKILVGSFCNEFSKEAFESNPKNPLQTKGFEFIYTTSEAEFVKSLPNCDLAWIISSRHAIPNPTQFVKACREFHESGGGLYVWGDNEPYFQHANAVLGDLINVTLTGNTPGDKTLSFGDPKTSGHFGAHLITSGITNLYEGVTISYPRAGASILQTIATSTNGNPVVLVAEQGENRLKDTCGRIVVDCGFTKLWCNWDTAGTARYVVNANVWLLGLDHKMRNGLALSRVAAKV